MLSVSRKGKKKHVYKRVSKQTCLEGGKRRRRKRTTTEHTHTHRERERERERVGQNCFSLCFHTSSLSPSSARSICSSSRLIVGMVAPGFEAASACSRSFSPFSCPAFYLRKKEERKGRRTWWPLCPRRRSRFTTNTKCFSFHRPADF